MLTPGRYVGAEEVEDDGEPFDEKMQRLVATLEKQCAQGARLEKEIRGVLEPRRCTTVRQGPRNVSTRASGWPEQRASVPDEERQTATQNRVPQRPRGGLGVVEQALLYFMDARRELPDEALVSARLVVEDKTFDRIAERVTNPPAPTKALRELMRGKND